METTIIRGSQQPTNAGAVREPRASLAETRLSQALITLALVSTAAVLFGAFCEKGGAL